MPLDPGQLPSGVLSGTEQLLQAATVLNHTMITGFSLMAGLALGIIFAITWKG